MPLHRLGVSGLNLSGQVWVARIRAVRNIKHCIASCRSLEPQETNCVCQDNSCKTQMDNRIRPGLPPIPSSDRGPIPSEPHVALPMTPAAARSAAAGPGPLAPRRAAGHDRPPPIALRRSPPLSNAKLAAVGVVGGSIGGRGYRHGCGHAEARHHIGARCSYVRRRRSAARSDGGRHRV
jgi:hypothetical protein